MKEADGTISVWFSSRKKEVNNTAEIDSTFPFFAESDTSDLFL